MRHKGTHFSKYFFLHKHTQVGKAGSGCEQALIRPCHALTTESFLQTRNTLVVFVPYPVYVLWLM